MREVVKAYCSKCRKEVSDNAKSCFYCGNSFIKNKEIETKLSASVGLSTNILDKPNTHLTWAVLVLTLFLIGISSNLLNPGVEPMQVYKGKSIVNGNNIVCSNNIVNGGLVARQGNWVYYSNTRDDKKLYKISTDGSERIKLNNDQSSYINVVGDFIYYINIVDKKLYKIGTDGSERTLEN